MMSDLLRQPHGFHSTVIQASSQSDLPLASCNVIAIKRLKHRNTMVQLNIFIFIITTSLTELKCDGYTTVHGLSPLLVHSLLSPPLFHPPLLSSPFLSGHPIQSRQMAAHAESGCRRFFQLVGEFLLSTVATVLAQYVSCWVSLYIFRSRP